MILRVYLLGSIMLSSPLLAGFIYVDAGAGGSNPGNSWSDAYTDLKGTLAAISGDEVWVAAGTYTPGTARAHTFPLAAGFGICGGFPDDGRAAQLSDRDSNPGTTEPTLFFREVFEESAP